MDAPPPLVTRGLTKSYRVGHILQARRPALQDLDLDVRRGEILGYVGPNGSGKTTTLKLLIGLLRPDRGEARLLGSPLADAGLALPGRLPARASLPLRLPDPGRVPRLRGPALRPSGARAGASGRASCWPSSASSASADVPMRRFSKGMVQRAGLAQALVNDPELLILDEPMSGLDPLGRRLVRDLILDLRRAGEDRALLDPHPLGRRDPVRPGGGAARRAPRPGRRARGDPATRTSRTWRCWWWARRRAFADAWGDARGSGWATASGSRSQEGRLGRAVARPSRPRAAASSASSRSGSPSRTTSSGRWAARRREAEAWEGRDEPSPRGGRQHLPGDGARAGALQPRLLRASS